MALDLFVLLCGRHGLPPPATQYEFAAPARRFAADYCWIAERIIVERDGGIFQGNVKGQRFGRGGGTAKGGHSNVKGILRDMEKSNLAQLAGFIYLRYTVQQLEAGAMIPTLKILIANRRLELCATLTDSDTLAEV